MIASSVRYVLILYKKVLILLICIVVRTTEIKVTLTMSIVVGSMENSSFTMNNINTCPIKCIGRDNILIVPHTLHLVAQLVNWPYHANIVFDLFDLWFK